MTSMSVRVLQKISELEALGEEWDAISIALGMPLLDHTWFASAAATLHRESDLRIVTVRESGRLVAAAPMAIDPAGRHLVVLGTSTLYEPCGWVYSSQDAMRHLARAVVDLGEVTVLDRVPAGLSTWHLLPRAVRKHAVTVTRETAPSFAVETNRPWSSLCASYSSSTRRRLEADKERAEAMAGPVRSEMLRPSAHDVDASLDLFTRIESSGWKGRVGSALANRPDLSDFFRTYARRAAARGELRVNVLWIGDAAAAAEVAVQAHGRYWGLKIGYDERFASCAPAVQLVHASVKAAADNGLLAYEFLGSAEAWQRRWKPVERTYQLSALYPLSRRAAVTALYDLASFVSRRIQQRPNITPALS